MRDATRPKPGDWYRFTAGPSEGMYYLSGWSLAAISTPDGWFDFGVCPRCFAMVRRSSTAVSRDDGIRGHERWHAATDHPIPEGSDD